MKRELEEGREEELKTHSFITVPPRGQRSPNSLSVPMMVLWVYVSSLVMICQRAAEKLAYFLAALQSNLIGCCDQTVLILKNLLYIFCQAWSVDHMCQVSRGLD